MASSVDYLVSSQQEAGGWGYSFNNRSVVEPTSMALIAIRNEPGIDRVIQRAVDWLLRCQHVDGGWGINEDDPESGWQTAWAVIALRNLQSDTMAVAKGVDWLTHVGTSQVSHEDLLKSQLPLNSDPGALIWPWLPGQVCWIEPTALAILALTETNISRLAATRMEAALAYFRSSRTPSGGWDIGNAGPLDTIVLPRAYPTALVLLALNQISKEDIRGEDLSALHQDLQRDPSALAQSAGLLAFQTLNEDSDPIKSHLPVQQQPNGSWNDNPFFTAWATIGLRGYF